MGGAIGRFPGGGGGKINGLIEQYKALAGENVSAGDFVEYVVRMASGSSDKLLSNGNYSSTGASPVLLPDGRVFIAHSNGVSGSNNYLYGILVTINGTAITAGSDTQLLGQQYAASNAVNALLLPDGNVLVTCNVDGMQLGGLVVIISGNTITPGTAKAFLTTNNGYSNAAASPVLLPDGRVFVAHANYYIPSGGSSTYRLYGVIVTINGTTITVGTDTYLSSAYGSGSTISAVLLSDGRVFIAHSYGDGTTYYPSKSILYGMVVTISGTTITVNQDTRLSAMEYSSYSAKTLLLPDGRIFIAHTLSGYPAAMIVTVNGTTITAGTDTQLSSEANASSYTSLVLLDDRVFIAHQSGSNNLLSAMVVTTRNAITVVGTDFVISTAINSASNAKAIELLDGRVFIAHGGPQSYGNYPLYGTLAEDGARRAKSVTLDLLGVAKTKPNTNGVLDVYVPNPT